VLGHHCPEAVEVVRRAQAEVLTGQLHELAPSDGLLFPGRYSFPRGQRVADGREHDDWAIEPGRLRVGPSHVPLSDGQIRAQQWQEEQWQEELDQVAVGQERRWDPP
jgi:hypothetical protein